LLRGVFNEDKAIISQLWSKHYAGQFPHIRLPLAVEIAQIGFFFKHVILQIKAVFN
jgi:hypothetical protein